jgi:hypothetical protein
MMETMCLQVVKMLSKGEKAKLETHLQGGIAQGQRVQVFSGVNL